MSQSDAPGQLAPSAAPSSVVTIEQNETQNLAFHFAPASISQHEPFIAFKPFLKYRTTDESILHYYPLPYSVYSAPFQDKEAIIR